MKSSSAHAHYLNYLKVNFTVTVFNSTFLSLCLMLIVSVLYHFELRAAARVTNWNIEIHLDELKDMRCTHPVGFCQIGFCVSLGGCVMWDAIAWRSLKTHEGKLSSAPCEAWLSGLELMKQYAGEVSHDATVTPSARKILEETHQVFTGHCGLWKLLIMLKLSHVLNHTVI